MSETSNVLHDFLLRNLPVRSGYRLLGPVVLYSRLGEGQMGVVYIGRHIRLNVDVAVKIMDIPESLTETERNEYLNRFRREARASVLIQHQNLIGVMDINSKGSLHYIVMDYVRGETLGARLKRKGPLPEIEVLEIIGKAAAGLGQAHREGIVHRDVKPDNIMVDVKGDVKVADLGLAKAIQSGESAINVNELTQSNQLMGTPYFMSPEQIRDARNVSFPADIWSLGVTMHQLLTGKTPWQATSIRELFKSIIHDEYISASRVCPDLSPDTSAIIEKSLRKSPDERYPDGSAMARALQKALYKIEEQTKNDIDIRSLLAADVAAAFNGQPTPVPPSADVIQEIRHSIESNEIQTRGGEVIIESMGAVNEETLFIGNAPNDASTDALMTRYRASLSLAESARAAGRANEILDHLLEAIRTLETILSKMPDDPKAIEEMALTKLKIAVERIAQKDWTAARDILSDVVRMRPNDTEALRLLSDTNYHLQDWANLRRSLDRYVKLKPADMESFARLSTACLMIGSWASARSAFDSYRISLGNATPPYDLPPTIKAVKDSVIIGRHLDKVWSVDFSSDGKRLISAGWDGVIRLWDVFSASAIRSLTGHDGWVFSASFNPSSSLVASAGKDRSIRIWDVSTGELKTKLNDGGSIPFRVCWHRDGSQLISCHRDGAIRFWDIPSHRLISQFNAHDDAAASISISPDSKTLATAGWDFTVRIWDIETRTQRCHLSGHTAQVLSVAYSADGRYIASGGKDKTVRVWDAQSGACVCVLDKHRNSVDAVAFASDGKTLISSGSDYKIRVWDFISGVQKKRLLGHQGSVHGLALSPDGMTIATGGSDHTIRIWNLSAYLSD